MEIYYYDADWLHGPVDNAELIASIKNGDIKDDTPVWAMTSDDWLPAHFLSTLADSDNSDVTPVIDHVSDATLSGYKKIPRPRVLYAIRLARDQDLITTQQAERCLSDIREHPSASYDIPGKLQRLGWITPGQRSSLSCLVQAQPNQNILAGYEILEKLGSGSMGTTYRARQISLDRILALKVLLPRFSQDPEYVRRFMREARLAAKLNHENIATAYEVGSSGGQYFLAMELIEGRTLSEIIRQEGPMPQKESCAIISKVCQALQYAHEIGIIHRDISPKNIIVRKDHTPKLIDLGLAKNVGGARRSDDTGTAVGTPAYISPEQALGRKKVDIRTDIYSLGCVFFEMLSGKPPFQGESALETISMHLNHNFPPIKRDDVSSTLKQIIKKMTHRNPNRRFQEPVEVFEALQNVSFTPDNDIEDIMPVMEQLEHWQGVQPTEVVLKKEWREYMHLIAQEIADRLEQQEANPEFQGYIQTTFTELVSNAFDHGCQGGRGIIKLRLELNKAFFRLEVEDDGKGFAANKMLEKLRNAPPDRERQRGLIQLLQIVDILEYNDEGNRVKAVLYRKSRGSGIFEERRDDIHFADIRGKGDMALTEEFRRWVDIFPVMRCKKVCLMVRTDWVSSMFVGSVAKLAARIDETGGQLAIWVERPSCRRIMHQLGLNTFVDIFSSFEESVKALKKKGRAPN